jgi:hypothetical protein
VRRLIGLAAALFVVGLACLSQAQVGQIPNWPPNTFVSGGGGGAITLVDSCQGSGAASATCTVNLHGANFLVIATTSSAGGSDDIGTTYVNDATLCGSHQTDDCFRYAYVSPVAGSVTFTAASCSFCVIVGAGYTGTIGSTIDQETAPGIETGGTNTCQNSASITPSTNNQLVIFTWAPYPAAPGGSVGVDSSFNLRQSAVLVGATHYGIGFSDIIQTTAGLVQPTYTGTGLTVSASECFLGSFK